MAAALDYYLHDFPECPVCLEIPLGEIFQCPNRHILCGGCAAQPEIQTCPQCRVPLLVGVKQRNFELEEELDAEGVLIPCRNSVKGCAHLVQRSEMGEHLQLFCEFSNKIKLCKLLGFQKCEFQFDPSNMSPGIQHCRKEHSFGATQGEADYTRMFPEGWNSFNSALVETLWAFFVNFTGREDSLAVGPLGLIVSSTSKADKTFSTRCYLLGDNHGGAAEWEARVCLERKQGGGGWIWETTGCIRITTDTTTTEISSGSSAAAAAVSVPLEAIKSWRVSINEIRVQVARKGDPLLPGQDRLGYRINFLYVKPSQIGDCLDNDVKCKGRCSRSLTTTLLRLKCLNCRKYNSCMACVKGKCHYPHVFAMLVSRSQEEFILRVERETPGRKGIVPGMTPKEACQAAAKDKEGSQPFASPCAQCSSPIEKIMFSCLSCAEFNLCEGCMSKGAHDANHIFALILSNSQEDLFKSRRQVRPVLLPWEEQPKAD